MIAKLSGLVDSVGEDWLIVDVGGVGYLVTCSTRTLTNLPPQGQPVQLHIEMHVREDHIALYGFADRVERDWFRLLTTVQGVGSKVALAVLGALPPDRLMQAIAAQDRAALTRAPGVGPKLAQRVLNELKDKAAGLALGAFAAASDGGGGAAGPAPAAMPAGAAAEDAVSALVNLGYGRSEAFGAVGKAMRELGPSADAGALIRAGLKELGPRV